MISRLWVVLPLLLWGVPVRADASGAPSPEAARFSEIAAGADTLAQLRRGGFVLYMRHGRTDGTRPDRYPSVDLDDCSTQRPLAEDGVAMARQVGESIRRARIPLGEIRISPLCRARDTAAAGFPGMTPVLDHGLMYTANLTDEEKRPILAQTRRLLSTRPAPGTNLLIIAHAPNLMDLMGYFPREGTVVVFRPLDEGNFEYVGSIPPPLWSGLVR